MDIRPNHSQEKSPKTSPLHTIELIKMRGLVDPEKELSKK